MAHLLTLKWLEGTIPPAAFLLTFWILIEPKCRKTAQWATVGFLGAELVVQGVIAALGDSPELVFTLLPLTFYLPAIVLGHLLSKYPFLPTAVGWLFALLCRELLLTVQGLLFLRASGQVWPWVLGGLYLLLAVGIVAAVARFVRKPFRAAAGELGGGWAAILFLPVMLLALYSYLLSDASGPVMLILLFFTALAVTLVTARLFSTLAAQRQARESRLQMEALRQDYDLLQKKLDLGRRYRHDIHHHMLALSALLQQGDAPAAMDYIASWQGQMTQVEDHRWCHSAAVNAVLSAYMAQAKAAGCAMEAEVSLPGELPFEEADLCVVLANALENAILACQAMPEGAPRSIKLELALSQSNGQRLTLHVENSCGENVEIGADGLPVTRRQGGHGQGLKSVAAVAEKYHGMCQCGCAEGVFDLRVVLLAAVMDRSRSVRRTPAVGAGILLGIFLLNCMPALAQTLEQIPVLGPAIRVVDLRSYAWSWGGTGASVEEPVLEGDDRAVEQVEAKKEDFISQMKDAFLYHAARKYQGYVSENISYEVVRDDDALFILRFDAILYAGNSVEYHRHTVLDKRTGRVLELSDLFLEDVDYVFPISREIRAQMEEQVNANEGDYFLPGGIWPEEDCFRSIDPQEQDFYIDDDGQLVIAFDEYEVAPGSMGAPSFTIPTDLLDGLLAQPSVLR